MGAVELSLCRRGGHSLRADDQSARIRPHANLLDDFADLVDRFAVPPRPRPPLVPIDRPQFALCVGPLIPDRHAMFVEITHVRVATQKPEQLVNNGLEMQLFCGERGETVAEGKPRLGAENGISARAGAIRLELAFIEDKAEQVEVLNHLREEITREEQSWQEEE